MQNRINNNKKIKQTLLDAGLANDAIFELFNLFDELEQKIIIGKADATDVELFVKSIHDLTIQLNEQQTVLLTKQLHKLAKNYTSLFALLLKVYNEGQRDQAENVGQNNPNNRVTIQFSFFLKNTLIEPMLVELAKTSNTFHISKLMGKIPIVTMSNQDNLLVKRALFSADIFLEDNMKLLEKLTGQASALKPYVMAFAHLNRDSKIEKTVASNKTFANYLETTKNINLSGEKILPRLVAISDEIMSLYSNSHLYGATLTDNKVIILSLNENTDDLKILRALIHEIQHFYNSIFLAQFEQINITNDLSNDAINQFIQVTDVLKNKNIQITSLVPYILNNIQTILKLIKHHDQNKRNLDELSAHLTSLLFEYSQEDIRDVIDQIMLYCSEMIGNNKNDVLSVCRAINNAFSFIEQTLEHFSVSLLNYTLDKAIEDFENYKDKRQVLDEMLVLAKKIKERLPSEKYDWNTFIQAAIEIELGTAEGVSAASHSDSTYALHEIAKTGDIAAMQKLLCINKIKIDELDENQHPAIVYAVINNRLEAFELLFNSGAYLKWIVNFEKVKGNNLLHVAAYYGSFALIPTLLNKGISANKLNAKKQSPLLTCAKYISTNTITLTDQEYFMAVTALAHLLSYTYEQQFNSKNDVGIEFYNALIRFRKNIALLFVLQNSGVLHASGILLPYDVINNIALQMEDTIPNETYKHCYRDMMQFLLQNKDLLSGFITLGMQSAYKDYLDRVQISNKTIDNIKKSLFELLPDAFIPHEFLNTTPLKDEEVKRMSNYYSTNLVSGSTSLTAVVFAQRQMQTNPSKLPATQEDKFKDRRLAIQEWKNKISKNEDEGLLEALLQACAEIGITDINNLTYHKLSSVLAKLVITDNKTPSKYSPGLFVQEFKKLYQDSAPSNQMKERSNGVKSGHLTY